MADKVYVAKHSFSYVNEKGHQQLVKRGARYREGHPVIGPRADLFEVDNSINELPEESETKRTPGRPRKFEQ